MAHRRDESDRPLTSGHFKIDGRTASLAQLRRGQLVSLFNKRFDLLGRDHAILAPEQQIPDRHEFDKPDVQRGIIGKLCKIQNLIIIKTLYGHGIDFNRVQPEFQGLKNGFLHFRPMIPPRNKVEFLGNHRIQAEIDPVETSSF
ncbi:MAG: hypothetical protein A4E72_02168 [Syntrophus sp. PtaU1.Bin208]|nr:MAG: hypothetical protein A4E72_02168 [Syntrophus sp. PtaU1.Bin208]